MDITSFNRDAWDKQATGGCVWSQPVTSEQTQAARKGDWEIKLTPTKMVPRAWFPSNLHGVDLLCLASGGGQQGPILAAAGATVTVFDNSPAQLDRDRMVAARDGLAVRTVQGDMADLSIFPNSSFDLIFNPVSVAFIPDVNPVWRECARVLRPGGALLVGFRQPHTYCLDDPADDGKYILRFSLPYADVTSVSEEERSRRFGADSPLEFSHTLTDLIGGQLAVGLRMVDLYEDTKASDPVSTFMPTFLATRTVKAE